MDRDAFVQRWRHELAGLVADAAIAKLSGAELSMRLQLTFAKIDKHLGKMYDDLRPAFESPKPASTSLAVNQPKRGTP